MRCQVAILTLLAGVVQAVPIPARGQGALPAARKVVKSDKEIQFRININDLALLRALGIDPTRKVRTARRVEPLAKTSDDHE